MGVEFDRRKAVGTAAETALCDLLAHHGAIVECHQQNHDACADHPGAAVAITTTGRLHLPDLSVVWPAHPIRRFGVEVKAKSPPAGGGWGWDTTAFNRACQWSTMTGSPVFYVVRDTSAEPLPPAGQLDDADHWHIATCWKLLHSPNRVTTGRFHFWPTADFLPLCVLLDGQPDISTQCVPFILPDIGPPILL